MENIDDLPSPKRGRSSSLGRAGWYPYYAGFSGEFAQAVLNRFAGESNSRVLDPWNGSGTTTAVTAGKGYDGFGFDLNPVMVVVARARLLNKRERSSLNPLAKHVSNLMPDVSHFNYDDPLTLWFQADTVRNIRRIETAIQATLMGLATWTAMEKHIQDHEFSDIVAFFYVGLFRTVRSLLSPFQSSNPTWMKLPATADAKLEVSQSEIRASFLAQIAVMEKALDADLFEKDGKVKIGIGDSQHIPLEAGSVDFVLSSPPYCTRIDYASATRAELSVLGMPHGTPYDSLRKKLLGTTTVPSNPPVFATPWGFTCERFLDAVKRHPSRASASYYYKGYCQYFSGIYESLRELSRCLKSSGSACLVVQDSFYKDIHNDLPQIYVEMAKSLDLSSNARRDFHSRGGMGAVNTSSRKYRPSVGSTESILLFAKN